MIAAAAGALRDGDQRIRFAALAALRVVRDEAAADLIIGLLNDPDRDIRRAAVGALNPGMNRAALVLATLSRSEDPFERMSSIGGLEVIGDAASRSRLVELLKDPADSVRGGAARALGRLEEPQAVDGLVALLRDPQQVTRQGAAQALGKIGDVSAVQALVRSLKDEDWNVRDAAAHALGLLGDRTAVLPLIEALRIQRFPAAAFALAALGDPRAFDPLVAAAAEPQIGEQRIASALVTLGDPRATEWLLALAKRSDVYDRLSVIGAIGKLKNPAGVDYLVGILRDVNQFTVKGAAEALREYGDPRTIDPLFAALQRGIASREWQVVEATSGALVSIGPQALPLILRLLETPEPQPASIIRTIAAFGPIADAHLIATLSHANSRYRYQAAAELAKRDGEDVVAALQSRLKAGDLWVVGGGYRFFLKYLDPTTVDALARALSGGIDSDSAQAQAYVDSGNPRLAEAGHAWLCRVARQCP